ncbi:MAG: 4-hydroxyproline epimerase [Calditrichaeota bacterium]|nr:MAG: 4-hydroxyproline epimerase [Calditrichota bacterium]
MNRYTFFCIDAHTCGNPVRVVVGGAPPLKGSTMAEKRLHFMKEYDWIRTGLMFEPRGHDMMSGSILYPPSDPECDMGILFIETSGCLPMCGHGTIGTVTVMIEKGLVTPREPGKLVLEVPAGKVEAYYKMENHHVSSVRIVNIPSFLYAKDLSVEIPDWGTLKVDVAYGGNFYAIIEPQETYTDLEDMSVHDILYWSPIIRKHLNEKFEFRHPTDERIQGLSHIQWTGKPKHPDADARNAVFYGEHAIDRSPCGTGTSARMAQLFARGELKVGDTFVHESIIGSLFTGRVEAQTTVGDFEAIIPSIEGWARITGLNTIYIDSRDPFAHGFQVI